MSPENAKLVNAAIALAIITWLLLVLNGKIVLRKKSDLLEKHKRILTILVAIGIIYPVYEILSVLFKWK